MPKQQLSGETVSEISVNPQPSGLSAVYLVETHTREESQAIGRLFSGLDSQLQVRQLCKGKLVGYAVQAHESDSALLDEIDDVLKTRYGFVVTQRSFDDLIYRIVRELCHDTGSRLLSIPHCNICGKTEPFPNIVISLSDGDGTLLMSRTYCRRCTAEAIAPSNKKFVRSLLAADKRNFHDLERAELVRRPSRKQPIRFKVRSGSGASNRPCE